MEKKNPAEGGASTNTVYAVGTLVRDDNRQISFPEAKASYNAQGPTSVVMASTTSSVLVGPWGGDTADIRLSFGDPSTAPGISFQFTATAPPGDSGYVAGTQLVNSRTTSTPPSSVNTTGGAYWLDACPCTTTTKRGSAVLPVRAASSYGNPRTAPTRD